MPAQLADPGKSRNVLESWAVLAAVPLMTLSVAGCATTTSSNTARTASEQVLISSAIDRAMTNVRFSDFDGYKVFIDPQYLDSTIDKGYLVGSIRAKVLEGGGKLVSAADAADVVLEPRSGGVGTDNEENYVGVPRIGVPGLPIEIPEIKLLSRNTQMGTAKIGLVCYDAKTGESLGSGGKATALAHNKDTFVLGMGPFRSGSVAETREKAVGFDGIGGSLLGSRRALARHSPVQVVDRMQAAHPEGQPFNPVPQIATLPSETLKH